MWLFLECTRHTHANLDLQDLFQQVLEVSQFRGLAQASRQANQL